MNFQTIEKKKWSWQPLSKFLHVTQVDKELPGPNSGYLVDLTPECVVSDWVGDKGILNSKSHTSFLLPLFFFFKSHYFNERPQVQNWPLANEVKEQKVIKKSC